MTDLDHFAMLSPIGARLAARITMSASGCWEFPVARGGRYGYLSIHSRPHAAHRLAWELVNGPIPEGMFVCHTCDNKPCCNPDHLWVGTHVENMADMAAKGRHAMNLKFGVLHHSAKLTTRQVRDVRTALAYGVPLRVIARLAGLHRKSITKIRDGLSWADV